VDKVVEREKRMASESRLRIRWTEEEDRILRQEASIQRMFMSRLSGAPVQDQGG